MSELRPERRAATRYTCHLTATCKLLQATREALWAAEAFDLSATGVGLLLHKKLAPRTPISVRLVRKDGGSAAIRAATVAFARPHVLLEGTWVTGCAFEQPLDEATLKALLGR